MSNSDITVVLGNAPVVDLIAQGGDIRLETGGQGPSGPMGPAGNFAEVAILAANTAAANATILQNAINGVSNTTLYLPAGRIPMNPVTMKEGVRVQGKGKEVTRLLAGSNSINIFQYTAATSTQFYMSICDIGFESNGKTGCQAIFIDGATSAIRVSNVTLKNIETLGTFACGVNLRYCAASMLVDVYTALAVTGITIDNCADTDLLGCRAQNGTGYGFNIVGGAGAFDEGTRMVACSTNGQAVGISGNGVDFVDMSACSFTTCSSGALITTGTCSNWKIAACDFSVAGGAPAVPNFTMSSGCVNWSISASQFLLGTFGAVMRGSGHTITGNTFFANSNVDIYLDAVTNSAVSGNVCKSTTSPWSILENGAADNNAIVGNSAVGLQVVVGANSYVESYASGIAQSGRKKIQVTDVSFTQVAFDVDIEGGTALFRATRYGSGAVIQGRAGGNTRASPTATPSGTIICGFRGYGYDTTNGFAAGANGSALTMEAAETWSVTAHGTQIRFNTTPIGSLTMADRLLIANDGALIHRAGAQPIIDANSHHQYRSYTVGTLPSAGTAGQQIWCSDLGGGAGMLESDGTVWKRLSHGGQETLATDADFTLTTLTSGEDRKHTGTLTANRAVTLSTTAAYKGARFRVSRTGGGAFTLTIAGKALSTNQWAEAEYDGTAWYLAASGTL